MPPKHQPARHHRQHAGHLRPVGGHIGGPGGQQADDHRQIRIAQAAHDECHGKAERDTRRQPARRHRHKTDRGLRDTEHACQAGRHGKAEQHQAGGIIDQAFAFQQHGHSLRQPHILQHRLGGHGIRRRHDRAQRETCSPGQSGHDVMRHHPHHQRGERHRPHRQLQDDAQIGAEIPPHREKRARHQQWRQEQHQHQIGVELQIRRAGDQRQHHTAHDQRRRRRQMQPPRHQFQRHHHAHQQQDEIEEGDGAHGAAPAAKSPIGRVYPSIRRACTGHRRKAKTRPAAPSWQKPRRAIAAKAAPRHRGKTGDRAARVIMLATRTGGTAARREAT